MTVFKAGVVYFAGAGPGDVELLTIKTRHLLECADVVLYAGSLVNPAVLDFSRPDSEKLDTAHLRLEEQIDKMVSSALEGKVVARIHTGDPSIFGAISEQIRALENRKIPYQIIPGVSSAFAASAALGIEYTLPEITQSVIFTRLSGVTPVPEREKLRNLAAHHSSLVIFLSTGLVGEVTRELVAAGYPETTPIAMVYRASWLDQLVVRGSLATITDQLEREEISHQGLIIVSPALNVDGRTSSHLYNQYQEHAVIHPGQAILALTKQAADLGRQIQSHLPGSCLYLPDRFREPGDDDRTDRYLSRESIRQVIRKAFQKHDALVCIMACGIVVRELAPLLQNKHSDPAVVVMDPAGRYAISLVSGHEGGANVLAQELAAITGGQAVITTASDVQNIPALDVIAKEKNWKIHPRSQLARVMADLIENEPVILIQEDGIDWFAPVEHPVWSDVFSTWEEGAQSGATRAVYITYREPPQAFWETFPGALVFHPPVLVVGVGCNRGAPASELIDSIETTLQKANLAIVSIHSLATVQDKADEKGLLEAGRISGWDIRTFTREEIRRVEHLPTPSVYSQKVLGIRGVAEPAAMLAAENLDLLVEKQKFANVTVAVGLKRG